MTEKSTLVFEIDVVVGANFDAWQIGLTNDPARIKRQWKDKADLSRWHQWQADSLDDAREIQTTFINNGMRPAVEAEPEVLSDVFPAYVYVF